MKRPSWVFTLATQMSLLCSLHSSQLGQPQESVYRHGSWKSRAIYFINVRGGVRPLKEQNHLLKLMEKVVKTYNARFVVNISGLGADDPLMHNVTLLFPALKVPWYSILSANVYISWQGCNSYALQDGITYVGTPSLPEEEEPHLAHIKGRFVFSKEMANGFLLHRVSLLEIVTYFVTSAGEVVCRIEVQQRDKEVM